jgi:hypothetical protein
MRTFIIQVRFWTAAFAAAWLSAIAFAAGPPAEILDAKNPRVQAVMAVQNEHTPDLMRIPGVVGTATSRNANGELTVKVFTEFPGVGGIPRVLRGVPVDVEVTGMFEARLTTADEWPRPVPIGVSRLRRLLAGRSPVLRRRTSADSCSGNAGAARPS